MHKFIIVLSVLFFAQNLFAQEFIAKVKVTAPNTNEADAATIKNLEQVVEEFYNNTSFTNNQFDQFEKIGLSVQLNIVEEVTATKFRADVAIQAIRPVYGSQYETPVISHADKRLYFEFEQFQPLQNSKDVYTDALSAALSFYAYTILGFDGDSFAPLGGQEHFLTAQNIINSIPPNITGIDKEWTSLGNRKGRYWIVENVLNPKVRPYREAMYEYHIRGLDVMHKDSNKAKESMMTAIKKVSDVNRSYPNSIIVQIFTQSKREEIIDIFKRSTQNQQGTVYALMSRMDAANASKYRAVRNRG